MEPAVVVAAVGVVAAPAALEPVAAVLAVSAQEASAAVWVPVRAVPAWAAQELAAAAPVSERAALDRATAPAEDRASAPEADWVLDSVPRAARARAPDLSASTAPAARSRRDRPPDDRRVDTRSRTRMPQRSTKLVCARFRRSEQIPGRVPARGKERVAITKPRASGFRADRFDVFVQRHAEKVGDAARRRVAVFRVEAHRFLQRLGRVERDACTSQCPELFLNRDEKLVGNTGSLPHRINGHPSEMTFGWIATAAGDGPGNAAIRRDGDEDNHRRHTLTQ